MEELIFKCFLFVKRLLRAGHKVDPLDHVPGGLSPAFGRLLGRTPPSAQGARYIDFLVSMASAEMLNMELIQRRNTRQSILVRFPELRGHNSLDHPQGPRLRNIERRIALLEEAVLKAGFKSPDSRRYFKNPSTVLKGVTAINKIETEIGVIEPLIVREDIG